jgi:hypothetical protein
MRLAAYVILSLLSTSPAYAKLPVGLLKLVGTFVSDDGYRFVVTPAGNALALRTNAELTRYPECHTKIGKATGVYTFPEDPEFGEVFYQLSRDYCPYLDGKVTLHHNRALTGVDVYLIDVQIRPRSTVPGQGPNDEITMRWSLTKISGLSDQ